MKSCYRPANQRGAVLLVALVMLLVLTLLAISGVREATLESRITANKAHALQLDNAAEAALREAEFRYFNPLRDRSKHEAPPNEDAENCKLTNTLKSNGANIPCLLNLIDDKDVIREYVLNPLELTDSNKDKFVENWNGLLWMPYRGRQAGVTTQAEYSAEWNTYSINKPEQENPGNVEYLEEGQGIGTYYYVANAKATDNAGTVQGAQSTFANTYVSRVETGGTQ